MFCNLNPFTTSYADYLFQQANLTNTADQISYLDAYWMNKTGSYLSLEQKSRMSNLDDMLVDCRFNTAPCDSSQFEFVHHPFFYSCYRFNSGINANKQTVPISSQLAPGYATALTLDLYAGLTDYQNYANNTLTKGFLATQFACFRTFVTQYNAWPYLYSDCTANADGSLIQPIADLSYIDAVKQTKQSYTQKA